MARKAFISYSRDDASNVTALESDIESLGHAAWVDRELTGGQRWWDQILKQIQDCDAFVFAVSTSALDSRACMSEYGYATALGKPVVTVQVGRNLSHTFMPPELGASHTIDYTAADKLAFAALNRAFNQLPEAGPLPEVLPPAPEIPASYLFDLKTEIESSELMPPATQDELLGQLKTRLREGHQPADVRSLVHRFRERSDLLVRIDRELAAFEADLDQQVEAASAPPIEAETPPIFAPPPEVQAPAPTSQSAATGTPAPVGPLPPAPSASAPQPAAAAPSTAAPGMSSTKRNWLIGVSVVVGFVILLGIIGAVAGDETGGATGDHAILEAVLNELHSNSSTSGLSIDVTVLNGVVTLSGFVPTADDADNAWDAAWSANGVEDVIDNLIVEEP